ncbi:uncharacterized protein LOC104583759 isoform X4 [Brachypodium distachyon]|uniref:uncharacterized protein LOC104583759 isoform X4 n=1 Tax=Brachypodium distachyon TaxID=15368 RepID=UPI00052FF2BB|nr:uncharacterized protein LOC104583759 isoform X4 [Brachypodium distachyon]|eukprot:XP_010235420.1 uncharacterized protein LOC104583759 isoform X4 [Brachypodium distachyon]
MVVLACSGREGKEPREELACSVTLHDGFYGSWKLEDLRTLPNQISAAPSSPSTVQDHLSASAQCLALRSVCAPAPAPMAASMPLRCLRRLLRAPPPSPPASSAGLQRFISSAPEVEGRGPIKSGFWKGAVIQSIFIELLMGGKGRIPFFLWKLSLKDLKMRQGIVEGALELLQATIRLRRLHQAARPGD